MHPKHITRRPRKWWGLLLVAGLATTVAYGQPPEPIPAKDANIGDVKVDAKTGALIVPVGGLVRFDPKLAEPPTDILVSREDILTVRLDPNNPRLLLLTGRTPGLTRLSIVLRDRPRLEFDVVVQPDYDLLRNIIRKTVPTANVEVTPGVGNIAILSGYVTSPQDADIITRLAISQVGGNANNVINAMQVGGVQQVQIDVVIAAVNRSELRDRGFDFLINAAGNQFGSVLNGFINHPTLIGLGGLPSSPALVTPLSGTLPFAIGGRFFGALQALRVEGLTKIMAEPRIVTQTGRPAFFRSGGQQAILSPTSGITGPGVQLVPFGTELEVLPIVYGNNQIWLEVSPRFSTPNQQLGINVGGAQSVGFTEQTVRCAVMLESGQTYAIGGLIQNQVTAGSSKIPVLGDLPYFGRAFSRETHQQQETELIVLVTPRLVHAMDCNQVPRRLPGMETRNPDDYELFLEGILEAPRGQRKVWNGKCYNAAYKSDPTLGTFPCVGPLAAGPGLVPAYGANCGPNGCAAPVARMIPGQPANAATIVPAQPLPATAGSRPATLPVSPASMAAEPVPATAAPGGEPLAQPLSPMALPPVVVGAPPTEPAAPEVPATLPVAPETLPATVMPQ